MVTVFSSPSPTDSTEWTRNRVAYLERLRTTDFRRSPHLPLYFGLDFFNDGKFFRFDYSPHQNTLILEMESVWALNDIFDLREHCGMPREMPHACVDFSYTCTFRNVVYLQVRRTPMCISTEQGEEAFQIPNHRWDDDYQTGEIQDSELRRELEEQASLPLFHLHFRTGWCKRVDVVFEKVSVRKVTPVRYDSFTEGRRVRLSHLFRGQREPAPGMPAGGARTDVRWLLGLSLEG